MAVDMKFLPPLSVGRWRLYERMALQIRDFVGIGPNAKLDPFALAEKINIRVLYLDDLPGLSDTSRAALDVSDGWSGGATQDLGDGTYIVILNARHSPGRRAATLMEEVCHILFGHRPSGIADELFGGRSYNLNIEEEAYGVGAAALVPYYSLRNFLVAGISIREIAKHFGVTPSLILYRARGAQLQSFIT
jgi:hypothetical protein